MRLFVLFVLLIALGVCAMPCVASRPDLTGVPVDQIDSYYGVLPPTPIGEGHLGPLSNKRSVLIRYRLPTSLPISYMLDFHNIVPMAGTGKSYQLQLRRGSANGPLVYDGPACNLYFFASTNRTPLEIAGLLTDEDIRRGYIDIYASCRVEGKDTWTMYRDAPDGEHKFRPLVINNSSQFRKRIASAQLFKDKGIHLLPVPYAITLSERDFNISSKTRILLASKSAEDLFSAEMLRDEIYKLSGIKLEIKVGIDDVEFTDILLRNAEDTQSEDQSYQLYVSDKFHASAHSSTGLFYAVQTVIQLLRKQGKDTVVTGAVISDHPSLEYRMVQYDVARFQTINIPYLKRIIREMSRFKLNQLMLYMEDDFKYAKYPFTGKPGTFTPESARELAEYGRKYHVEVVPQLEALGHGTALLSHPEFTDLRENGNPWVFDTSNPRTWQVLDDMIGELTEAFNGTKFIHLGCDEFEDGFGKCPECKAQIEKIGWGGLYAQHVTKLNELAKKHGRTMIIWAAHGGHGDVTDNDITIKYANLLPKDIVVMEWNYDPLPDYPTVLKLQKAGFSKVFVAPGVMAYAMVNPDNGVSFGSIRNFTKYGVQKGVAGSCTCTWELGYGSQLENHLYGLIYSGYCGWNYYMHGEDAFQRAFAQHWFGLKNADPTPIRKLFHLESLKKNAPVQWANGSGAAWIFWTKLQNLKKESGLHWPVLVAAAPEMVRNSDEMLKYIASMKSEVTSNQVTLDAMETTVYIYRTSAKKILAIDKVMKLYRQAQTFRKSDKKKASGLIQIAINTLLPLKNDYALVVKGLEQARDQRGASPNDVKNAIAVSESIDNMVNRLKSYKESPIPEPESIGL